jgi:RimJ/RimL family protein N-acetyltransferase
VVVDDEVAGWVDAGDDHDWLRPGERNLGYFLAPPFRNRGVATRAVRLLVSHLAAQADVGTAVLVIEPDNVRSLALAERAGFTRVADMEHDGKRNTRWERSTQP